MWNCCTPLFLGLRSTQSPIKAPSRSTDPATTNPNTAVNSKLRPYSSIRKTEIAKCHMRSPCLIKHTRLSLCVLLQDTGYSKTTLPLFMFWCLIYCIAPVSSGNDSYPHWQRSADINEKLGTLEVDKSWTFQGNTWESNECTLHLVQTCRPNFR